MKTVTDQFDFDFQKVNPDRALLDQWEKNMRDQADQWTTEAMAMHWSGIHHKEDWETLPRYERNRIVDLYEFEQLELEWRIKQWEPLYELIQPDGSSEFVPSKPSRIREFHCVDSMPSQAELDIFRARAKEMADILSADWSARRPPSIVTYNPFLASEVSLILGRKIEAVYPPPEVADAVPVVWKIFTALQSNSLSRT